MKRKFSFGLAPLKIPSRADNRALKNALNSNIDFGETPISSPLSPYIYRRPLDSRTERELYHACAQIATENDEPEQKLNFQPLHATKPVGTKPDQVPASKPVQTHSTTDAQSSQPPSLIPNRLSSKSDARHSEDSYKIPVAQEVSLTTARLHDEPSHDGSSPRDGQSFPPRKDVASTRTNATLDPPLLSPPDRPRTAPFDSTSEMSSATPKTASTDRHFNYASTALTSAELTPPHISKCASHLVLDNEAYRAAQHQADAEAAMWMRQELEKRRQEAQTIFAPQPPPSRSSARGWISDVREFIRPGSPSGLRPGSSSGARPTTSSPQSGDSQSLDRQGFGSIRSSSTQGWRSWSALGRKSSKNSFSDMRGDEYSREQEAYENSSAASNLNKGLPSLPSLDSWKDPKSKSGQHISTLMKNTKKGKGPEASTVPRKPVPLTTQEPVAEPLTPVTRSMPQLQASFERIKAEISPSSPASRTVPIAKSQVRRITETPEVRKIPALRPQHSKSSSTDSCFSPASSSSVGAQRSVDLNRATERLVKQESNVDLIKVSESLEKHQRMQKIKSYSKSTTSLTHQQPLSDGSNQTRPTTQDGRTLNFSRKISTDIMGRVQEARFSRKVEITALPVVSPKKHTISRLRRVLSKLEISNKANRQQKTWMDTVQAGGRTTVMEARGPSVAPVAVKH